MKKILLILVLTSLVLLVGCEAETKEGWEQVMCGFKDGEYMGAGSCGTSPKNYLDHYESCDITLMNGDTMRLTSMNTAILNSILPEDVDTIFCFRD